MSAQEDEGVFDGDWDQAVVTFNGLPVLDLMQVADGIESDTAEEAMADVDVIIDRAAANSTPATADQVRAVLTLIKGGLSDGELSPENGVWDFFRYLRYNLMTPVITTAAVTSGWLADKMLHYAEEKGYKPPKPKAKPVAKPTTGVTHGQRVVKSAATQVTPQYVTAPQLSKAEAASISKAIGIATADSARITAAAIDAMLPNLAPGQVTENLTELDQAATVLERQVTELLKDLKAKAPAAVQGQVSGVSAALTTLETEVAKLTAQVGLTEPSALDSRVNEIGKQVESNTKAVDHLSKLVPDLATTAALTAVTAKVAVTVEELGLKHASALDTALNGVESTISDLKRQVDDDDECCATNADNIASTIESLGGKSLLSSLGSLAGKAFEVLFVASLVDTVVTVLDWPAAVAGTVYSAEKISEWAAKSAQAASADVSWGNTLAGAT